MNRIVVIIILIAGVVAAVNFAVNYFGFYRTTRRGKRRLSKSTRRTIRVLAFGVGTLIVLDMFLSYAAACAGRLWSVVVLILNALFLVGLVIGTVQSTARQSGILGAVAIPVIICIAITVAGTFPTSLPAALFSLGGALIGIGLFRLIQNLFNAEARYNRHASPSP